MAKETLVHIVPTVPPAINGLADYCYKLWEHWPQPRPQWKCLAAQVPDGAHELWPEVQIAPFELSKNGLLRALEQAASRSVVLHYVGFAYQKKGVPLWLAPALSEWKHRNQGRDKARLCVIFHELYARGNPRQSAYWLQPWSKRIVAQLVQVADNWIATSEIAADHLVSDFAAASSCGHIVPVGANIEPAVTVDFQRPWPLIQGRKLSICVFGLPSTRAAALNAHSRLLKLLYEHDLVEEISLIGKSAAAIDDQMIREIQRQIAPDNLWRTHYDLAPSQISILLLQHDLALSRDWPQLLTKSGSYAAACVHGLITVCQSAEPGMLRAPGRDSENALQMPYLINNDRNAPEALSFLQDAEFIRVLKTQIHETTRSRLSWESILRVWTKATAS